MHFEGEASPGAMAPDGFQVLGLAVAGHADRPALWCEGNEQVEPAPERPEVPAAARPNGTGPPTSFLRHRPVPRTGMGRWVQPEHEPGVAADECQDTERGVLGELEGLEMVGGDVFRETAGQLLEGESLEQQSVAPETGESRVMVDGAQPRDRASWRWAEPATSPAATGTSSSGRLR